MPMQVTPSWMFFLLAITKVWATEVTDLVIMRSQMTWNDARSTCELNGARLVELKDETKHTTAVVVAKRMHNNAGGIDDVIHIALAVTTPNTLSFRWTETCAQLTWLAWTESNSVADVTKQCGALNIKSGKWIRGPCNTKRQFMCEYKKGPICPFNRYYFGYTLRPDNSKMNRTIITTVDKLQCEKECLARLFDGGFECWAYFYEISGPQCSLFFTANPGLCHEPVYRTRDLTGILMLKICYNYRAEFPSSTVPVSDQSLEPEFDCVESTTPVLPTTTPVLPTTKSPAFQRIPTTTITPEMSTLRRVTSTLAEDTSTTHPESSAARNATEMTPRGSTSWMRTSAVWNKTGISTPPGTADTTQAVTVAVPESTQAFTVKSGSTEAGVAESAEFSSTVNTPSPLSTVSSKTISVSANTSTEYGYFTGSTTTGVTCRCPCWRIFSDEEKAEFVTHLLQSLTLDKQDISSVKRKYFSAADDRPVAVGIGWTGIICLGATLLLILVSDASTLAKGHDGIDVGHLP